MQDLKLFEKAENTEKKAGQCSVPGGVENRFDLQADAHVRLGSVTGSVSKSSKHYPKDFGAEAAVGCLSLYPSQELEQNTDSVVPEEDLRPTIYLMSLSSGFTVKNKFVSEDQLKQFLAPSYAEHYLP